MAPPNKAAKPIPAATAGWLHAALNALVATHLTPSQIKPAITTSLILTLIVSPSLKGNAIACTAGVIIGTTIVKTMIIEIIRLKAPGSPNGYDNVLLMFFCSIPVSE